MRWADWVVGVIHSVTGGGNLIFYNDHTGGARGLDVNTWKQLNLPNYQKFHGVIFHGRPTDYNPDNTAYTFRHEKIFQLSTDGGPPERGTEAANYEWTKYAFSKKMMFQAHSLEPAAARGIGRNNPTELVPELDPPGGGIGEGGVIRPGGGGDGEGGVRPDIGPR